MRRVFVIFMVLLTVGCSSSKPNPAPGAVDSSYSFSPDEVREKALRDAAAAIASGKLVICETGTIVLYSPGLSESELEQVRGLPRRTLPNGCDNPETPRSIFYAEVFNQEIVRHVAARRGGAV